MKPRGVAVFGVLILASASGADLPEDNEVSRGACPGSGACCQVHVSPGCTDVECCDFVCSLESQCCDVTWGQECADFASSFCVAGTCAAEACPAAGGCCQEHFTPGCSDAICCEAVCVQEPLCCSGEWGTACANAAQTLCSGLCGGLCPGAGSCCQAHPGPGCQTSSCCQAVCAQNAQCCQGSWDAACVALARTHCGTLCGQPGCPGTGDCCECTGLLGCNDVTCCDIVCFQDPACCENGWDQVCVDIARTFCNDYCTCPSFGDFDGSGDVNLRDLAAFGNCFTGPSATIACGCDCADENGDRYGDLDDYSVFYVRFVGP